MRHVNRRADQQQQQQPQSMMISLLCYCLILASYCAVLYGGSSSLRTRSSVTQSLPDVNNMLLMQAQCHNNLPLSPIAQQYAVPKSVGVL